MLKIVKCLVMPCLLAIAMMAQAEEPAGQSAVVAAAVQGDAKSQARLGAMYLLGSGIEKNEQQAAEWLLKAAKQGHIEAQVMMAAMYDSGVGVGNDVKIATQWYEKAAAQGHAPSLAILGKNSAAKGSVAFSYQAMRLKASKQIPGEYAKQILLTK